MLAVKQLVRRAGQPSAIVYWLIGLPLLTIPFVGNEISWSKFLRTIVLFGLAIMVLSTHRHRQALATAFRSLPVIVRYTTALFGLLAVISSLTGPGSFGLVSFGEPTDNEGLLIWLSYLILAIFAGRQLVASLAKGQRLLLSIGVIVLSSSMMLDLSNLWHGFRLVGLLFQATGIGVWACLLLAAALFGPSQKWLTPAVQWLAASCILLSQSRIAIIGAALLLLYNLLLGWRTKTRSAILIRNSVLLGYMLLIPLLFKELFIRLQLSFVSYGSIYRDQLYRYAIERITTMHLWLLGVGAGNGGAALNHGQAPIFIAQTKAEGFVFWYAHDLFLDFAIMFGVLAALCFAIIIGYAIYTIVWRHLWRQQPLLTSWFTILLLNALVNTPSLELSSLLLLITYAVIYTKNSLKTAS